jgi:hypothetical protein
MRLFGRVRWFGCSVDRVGKAAGCIHRRKSPAGAFQGRFRRSEIRRRRSASSGPLGFWTSGLFEHTITSRGTNSFVVGEIPPCNARDAFWAPELSQTQFVGTDLSPTG